MTTTSPDQAGADAPRAARLIDRGYRRYDGERGGVRSAMRTVTTLTLQRALGLRRPARAKVFPVLAIVLAYLPTAVYVGITVIGNRLEEQGAPGDVIAAQLIPTYASNYGHVVLAIIVIASFVAPEVLCPDRRTGMLGLYLASPLTRASYLLAKGLSVLIVVGIVTIGPPLVLLIGYSTQGYGPDGLAGWLGTFARIIGAGLAVSLLYTVLSLAISSITSRKAAASAAFLAVLVGTSGLVSYLVVDAGQTSSLGLLNLGTLPYEAVFRIFGEPSELTFNGEVELSTVSVFAAYVAWVLAGLLVITWRYRRIEVTK
jgi:ABC-2 type transport system permease protein